jgi:hypothetical protein
MSESLAEKSPIHCIDFNSQRWYCLSDISNYYGYQEYALKWPQTTIKVIETVHEIDERDPVEYVIEEEFFTWLEWKHEYQNDPKIEKLVKLLLNQS